ncbi:Uma2 family endonuclease [Anabaena azotica]|uniref:Uma2 family endonuclease n=1 Tax=Anabaena azotica FACHB-119 TaxID=947527 RepID=A0ABR8DFD7_9NOST|nr:Uma2 family endonuclease [Anabaena azotica]MBD2504831.1 Uma2 family endonuclease [Anabaena azotica FACHB-119]
MTSLSALTLPDHTQLPDSDGTFVFAKRVADKNWQEHPQSILLTDSIEPVIQTLHPDGHYCIGQDMGIYWRLTDPPEKGATAPDWFFVPNVPPTLSGKTRRSYVLWKEYVAPLIVIEFVSGDGREERDRTPPSQGEGGNVGKFWIYEQAIRVPYYAIYEATKAQVEVYHLVDNIYQLMQPNERGHYPIAPMGVELGIWQGVYRNVDLPWLRWWDAEGNLLLDGYETAEIEKQRAEVEKQRAEVEKQKRERIVEKLRNLSPEQLDALGINPDLLD